MPEVHFYRLKAIGLWPFNGMKLERLEGSNTNKLAGFPGFSPVTFQFLINRCKFAISTAGRLQARVASKILMVPEARLELAHLAAEDFESSASTVPPLGPRRGV